MKKTIIALVLFILLVTSACGSPAATPTQATSAAPAAQSTGKVIADAWVMPVRWAALSFKAGGPAVAVKVQESDHVKAGDVLAQLDDTDARLAVAQAEAALALAQAQLAQAKAPARPAKITDAEQGIKEAEAGILAAQAQLAQLQTAIRPADIAAAEAALSQAALNKKIAEDRAAFAEKGEKQNAADALTIATQEYVAAQKRLNQLKVGPTQAELDAVRAGITAAQAQQGRAQAQLDLLKAGATKEQIAVAEAGVKQAQAALDTAKAALKDLQLLAPFDGVIASLNVKTGEVVAPGVPLVWLADVSAWQIETDDLTELSVVRVKEGDPVTITFDAVPGLELGGKVVRIKQFGEDKRGDMTYTVIIQPDKHDARLRWNMTASVTIGQ